MMILVFIYLTIGALLASGGYIMYWSKLKRIFEKGTHVGIALLTIVFIIATIGWLPILINDFIIKPARA